jgi:Fe-coproporphyrin III synthase
MSLVFISALGQRSSLPEPSPHVIKSVPVLVLSPHNQCNCRCVMCEIWRIRDPKEITSADLENHLNQFRQLGVCWVVFTGGEPQLNRGLFSLAAMLRAENIRVTLLTAGLLLESDAEKIASTIDDLIVSLDGPPAVHDSIRRVPAAFERMSRGVRALRSFRPGLVVRARCTVQRANHRFLRAAIQTAKHIQLNSISFLAADTGSTAFNHPNGWSSNRQQKVALTASEVQELEAEIESIIRDYQADMDSGFVAEDANKLKRILLHFRAQLGQAVAVAPRCNAPWVSAVIEASGDVRPCFFHGVLGNIHRQKLDEILNTAAALDFRQNLDIASNPICRQCVCSLYIPPANH